MHCLIEFAGGWYSLVALYLTFTCTPVRMARSKRAGNSKPRECMIMFFWISTVYLRVSVLIKSDVRSYTNNTHKMNWIFPLLWLNVKCEMFTIWVCIFEVPVEYATQPLYVCKCVSARVFVATMLHCCTKWVATHLNANQLNDLLYMKNR